MEEHKIALSKLCRACGEKFSTRKIAKNKNRNPLPVDQIKDEIFLLLGEDISQDTEYTHPDKICRKCYLNIVKSRNINDPFERIEKYSKEREIIQSLRYEWKFHIEQNCKICDMSVRPKSLFRREDKKQKGENGIDNISFKSESDGFTHLTEKCEMKLNENVEILHKENLWILFNCVICQRHFKRNTVKTKCSHYFCSDCLSQYFWHGQINSLPCPICKDSISYDEIEASDWLFKMQLFNSFATCHKCKITDRYSNFFEHECDGFRSKISKDSPECKSDKENEVPVTPIINCTPLKSVHETLTRNINSPLNKTELKVLTHLTRRHEDNGVLRCPTRGQSIHYARISKSRKKSKIASAKVVKRRCKTVTNIRKLVSGGVSSSATRNRIKGTTEKRTPVYN